MCSDNKVKILFGVLGVDVQEVSGLFTLLSGGDESVDYEEFMAGVMRVRGGSKQLDLVTLMYENKKVLLQLEQLKAILLTTMQAGEDILKAEEDILKVEDDISRQIENKR